jgi:hypothetical protein
VPIAIGRFYKQCLWIPQMFLLTNPDLHHGLLGPLVPVLPVPPQPTRPKTDNRAKRLK